MSVITDSVFVLGGVTPVAKIGNVPEAMIPEFSGVFVIPPSAKFNLFVVSVLMQLCVMMRGLFAMFSIGNLVWAQRSPMKEHLPHKLIIRLLTFLYLTLVILEILNWIFALIGFVADICQ